MGSILCWTGLAFSSGIGLVFHSSLQISRADGGGRIESPAPFLNVRGHSPDRPPIFSKITPLKWQEWLSTPQNGVSRVPSLLQRLDKSKPSQASICLFQYSKYFPKHCPPVLQKKQPTLAMEVLGPSLQGRFCMRTLSMPPLRPPQMA